MRLWCVVAGDEPGRGDPGGPAGQERGGGERAAAEVWRQRRGVRPTQRLALLPQEGPPAR